MLNVHFIQKNVNQNLKKIPFHIFLSKPTDTNIAGINIIPYFQNETKNKDWTFGNILDGSYIYHLAILNSSVLLRKPTPFQLRDTAYFLGKHLRSFNIQQIIIHGDTQDQNLFQFAQWIILGNYAFARYKKDTKTFTLQDVYFETKNSALASKQWQIYQNEIESIKLTQDVVNTPAKDMSPAHFAQLCSEILPTSVKIQVLSTTDLTRLGFGALLSVGQGSSKSSKVVIAHYEGSTDDPIVLAGKGVCFDSGGLNMKSMSSSIEKMYADMGGAATVLGVINTAACNHYKQNIVGIMGMVENMVDANSFHTGDIVTSYAGKTIKVDNTDAEGRLVLADLLAYAGATYQPKIMIDIATLTGAIVIALGDRIAGLFSDDKSLTDSLIHAGEKTGDLVWPLPLGQYFDHDLRHQEADLQNTNLAKRGVAGSSFAAAFLKQFVDTTKTKWAHIDIAGTTISRESSHPYGATGFGVQLICYWLQNI